MSISVSQFIKEEIKLLYGEDEVGSRNICQVIGMQYGGLLNDVCKNDDRKVFTDWLKWGHLH